jgi:integrase
LYTNQTNSIDLSEDPEWRAATKTANRLERETPSKPPPPLTYQQYLRVKKALQGSPRALLFFNLLWAFAARAGDIGGMKCEDVTTQGEMKDGLIAIAMTIRRGKGARFRGPYGVASAMLQEDAAQLTRQLNESTGRLFPDAQDMKLQVRNAVKGVCAEASLPSVRKGAARHLAQMGVPEADIARLMGHTRLDTLRRYLGYSTNLTNDARKAQQGAALLQRPQE